MSFDVGLKLPIRATFVNQVGKITKILQLYPLMQLT